VCARLAVTEVVVVEINTEETGVGLYIHFDINHQLLEVE
jgi:hypothetical protein